MAGKTYNRIKEYLAKIGKTNLELAEFMNVHEQTVSGWCTNENQPALEKLFRISDFFDVEVAELINLKKDVKPTKSRKKTASKIKTKINKGSSKK